ncbi:MAG: hypothetical protein J6D36_00255 [Erysipelotrichaceae bacterium]|nr:hypothetical protein [Erysipelotrichaceae bacterium]
MEKLSEELLLALAVKNSSGGGTTNYNNLENLPKIGGVTLTGNKTAGDLGLASENDLANKQDALLYGGVNPSSGADGDMYVKLARDESTLIDMFGSPSAESTDDYEMSYTVDSSVMGDYYDYEAFGTGKGFGQNGRGSMTITYHFKNSKFKPVNVSYCNNFNLSGGGYLESANFAIKASNDGTNWDTLYSTTYPCPRDTIVSADIATNTYYSYFKFEMNSGGGYTGIRNIVMNGISESYSNIDNIYFKNDGAWLKDAFAKKSELDAKQDTLTFDDVPTENSDNPVKSGGVYTALASKQSTLTAGDYVSINNNEIKVRTSKGTELHSYKFTSEGGGYYLKVEKYVKGTKVSETTYSNGQIAGQEIDIDGVMTLTYTYAGYLWSYTLLTESREHLEGQTVSWYYSDPVEFTENFDIAADASKNLVLKEDLDAAISSAYHHAGTKTCAELVAGLLVAGNEGNVYNMTDSGTTTADFIEGAGQPIKAGDNVGIAKISDGVYMFDLLSGFVDTTNFVQKSQTAGLLKNDGTVNEEIEGDVDTLKEDVNAIDSKIDDSTTYSYASSITIEDAVPANVAECNVKIEPVQSGSGDPSPDNVRPITGHTEVSVDRVGFNIWDGTATDGKGVGNNGTLYNDATLFATGYVRVFPNVTYYLNGTNWKNWVWVYDGDKNVLQEVRVNTTDRSIVFPSGTVYARFTGILDSKSTACINVYDSALNGSYAPYAGKTYTIALGNTAYGGTVNFNTGVMTVDRAVVDLGSLSYTYISENNRFNANITGIKLAATRTLDIMSECYEAITDGRSYANVPNNSIYNGDRDGKVFIHDNRYTDATDLATALNGMNLVYPIATPTTIQLTPQQIQLLKGQNTLTASTGQISVTVNGVSGAIGAVQEQVNELVKQLPNAPTTDGTYNLQVTVADGVPTYSWESAV